MRRRSIIFALLFLLCLALASWNGAGAAPAATTLVSVKPASGIVRRGEIVRVEVWVENVSELYGADIQLQFDPAAWRVLDANSSLDGVQIKLRSDLLQPGFVIHKEADNLAGTVWYANSQSNPTPPASGSGALFEFFLLAQAEGPSALSITSQQLSDRSGTPIPAEAQGAAYEVQGMRLYLPDVRTGR